MMSLNQKVLALLTIVLLNLLLGAFMGWVWLVLTLLVSAPLGFKILTL